MKKNKEIKINDNGTTTTIETIETTPEDGFVHGSVIRPTKMQHYGKDNTMYHKGYSKTFTYTTDDPRITRPVAYTLCGIFVAIGIIMLLFRSWFFGIIFTAMGIFALSKSKKDIDKKAEELKQKGYDVTIDSKEEAEQLKNEVVGTFKAGMDDAIKSTFTKERFNWFLKTSLPIYAFIVIVVSLLLGIFISIFLGVIIFIMLSLGGLVYYYIISKICKH